MISSRSPLLIFAVLALIGTASSAQVPREIIPLVQWEFSEDKTPPPCEPPAQAQWMAVAVPHIFRKSGLKDNTAGWYRLKFEATAADQNRQFYLKLEGAASVQEAWINGQPAGQHKGAFTAAAFDLTPGIRIGETNQIDLRVSNRDEETVGCMVQTPLYYVNGGMFRKAWLIKTGAVHIYPELGASGVFLTPNQITDQQASLSVRTIVRNPLGNPSKVRLVHCVKGPDGKTCAQFEDQALVQGGEIISISGSCMVLNPQLWDLQKPALYTVRTELYADGAMNDVVTEQTGFRTIEKKEDQFYLNGHPVRFHGVNKHAQDEYDWNAVSDESLQKEWDLMIDMGVNFVRLPHYPHSKLEYDIADQRGIPVWAENGFAAPKWQADMKVTAVGEHITREMVYQNWNHPSILFWSAGNEVGEAAAIQTAGRYARLIREEDPDRLRLVTYAACGGKSPTDCDFVAWNTYHGWYDDGKPDEGRYDGFRILPLNRFVSESGCGDWITHHIPHGVFYWNVDLFEPEEYAQLFTEYRLQTVCRNDPGNHPLFLWWNFREFYNVKFKGNRNTKGILTLAGLPKDSYYLFQSFLNKNKQVVHLCERTHFLRKFSPDNGIKAYSNARGLTLTLNGIKHETLKNGAYQIPDSEQKDKDGKLTTVKGIPVENVFFWKTPLQSGRNVVKVTAPDGQSDEMIVYQQSESGPSTPAAGALVQNVRSSNPANPALYIDRPIEAQGPFYSEVDGSSDNTLDLIPDQLRGAAWIATRRMSHPTFRTDLSFRINLKSKGAMVYVLFSKGTFPAVTLKAPDRAISKESAIMAQNLAGAGFTDTGIRAVWRDHDLNRADANLWSFQSKPGATIKIPGSTLDYLVLVK